MNFEKIFSRAIKYPLNIQVFSLQFVVSLIISYAMFTLLTLLNSSTYAINILLGVVTLAIVATLAGIFLMTLYVHNAAEYYSGRRKSLLASVATAEKKFLKVLGTYLLMVIILGASSIPLIVVTISIFSGIVSLAGIVIGLAILLATAFFIFISPYVAILDKFGVVDSIKNSVRLVRKNKLNMLLFFIVYLGIIILIRLASLPIALSYAAYQAVDPLTIILQSLISAYTTLFAYSAFTNFYLNVRKK